MRRSDVGAVATKPWKVFLSTRSLVRGRLGRAARRPRWRANCPHGLVVTVPMTTDSPLTLAGYSGEAAIPKRPHQEGTSVPPRKPTLSPWAYGPGLSWRKPGTTWDFHRSVLLTVVNR